MVSEPGYIKSMRKKNGSYVLIDLRPVVSAQRGHIKGAVSIPAAKVANSRARFPKDKKAPIILYTKDVVDESAFNTIRNWGYTNVSVLNGGMQGWLASRGTLVSGDMPTTISYVKKTPRGEISIEDFEAIVKKNLADKFILDVRDSNTAAQGMLKGAVNIPLADVELRLKEIPRDKEIIIHCNTGIMAGMSNEILKKNGYKTRIVNAVVQIDADGNYEITEK